MANLSFIQLNLHISPTSNLEVNKWLSDGEDRIALCQEPGQHKSKVKNIHHNFRQYVGVHPRENIRPRTCILINSTKIRILKLTQFCNRDLVSLLIDDKLIIASCYMPGEPESTDPPPQILRNLVEYCDSKNIKLIIGSDVNAHHTVWGSIENNARGETLLEFLVSTDLNICNIGNRPTYMNVTRGEILDLTFATSNVRNNIRNWKILDKDMFSDHKPITFELDWTYIAYTDAYRNVKKTMWTEYRNQLEFLLFNATQSDDLDILTEEVSTAIMTAYENSCPMKNPKKDKKLKWWNNDLAELKKDLKRKRVEYTRNRTEENRILKQQAFRTYKKELKKAQTESWQKFCSETDNLSAVAKLQRLMKMGKMADIGTLRRADGTFTTTTEETLSELIDTLIPSRDTDDITYDCNEFFTELNKDLTQDDIDHIVNDRTIIAAVRGFKPFKAPGMDGIYPVLLQRGIDILLPHLKKMFKLSICAGKLAKSWLQIKTIFIPKPGKGDYSIAKSLDPLA